MELFVGIVIAGVVWWIVKWANSPVKSLPDMPVTKQPEALELLKPPQPATSSPQIFRKEQALLAAEKGHIARTTLLQILDNAGSLGLTADEVRLFELALKAKAPPLAIAVDPRTIQVRHLPWDWELHQMWLESDEYRTEQQEALNDR